MQSSHHELLETYERRLEEFEHNLDAQTFHRDAEQAEAWIAFRESFLGNEEDDLGVGYNRWGLWGSVTFDHGFDWAMRRRT